MVKYRWAAIAQATQSGNLMTLTITLSDPLASRLQSRADTERVPVGELASRLLEHGIQSPLDAEPWRIANQRRLVLIQKRFSSGLSNEEAIELQQLQELADRQLEEMDMHLLHDVASMENAAQRIGDSAE
jgi:hypothetical protein